MALPSDLVRISNPKLPPAEPATTTRDAFDSLWKERGFEIVEEIHVDGEPMARDTPAKAPASPKGDKA